MKRCLTILLVLLLCGCQYEGQVALKEPELPVERVQVFAPMSSPVPTPIPLPTAEITIPKPRNTRQPVETPVPVVPTYAHYFTCTEADLELAAKVAYLEARGKGETAYRAVLCVIYNRCMAPRFGGGITDIETEVYRKSQFSVINHKNFDSMTPPEEIVEYAREIFYNGNTELPYNILFFCASRLGKNWGGRKFYKDIGGNLFFYGNVE